MTEDEDSRVYRGQFEERIALWTELLKREQAARDEALRNGVAVSLVGLRGEG